jgi:hypothetical protein
MLFFRSGFFYISDPDSVLIFPPPSHPAFSPTSPDTHLGSSMSVGQLACGVTTILVEPELDFHDAGKASPRVPLADFPRAPPLVFFAESDRSSKLIPHLTPFRK